MMCGLVVGEFFETLCNMKAAIFGRTLASIFCYSLRPAVIAAFMRLSGRDWRPWLLVIANAAIHLTALFSGVVFRIDANNVFYRGPLGWTCLTTSAILLVWHVASLLLTARRERTWEALIPLLIAAGIICASIADVTVMSRYRVSMATVASVSACVFYYIWLHLRFAREHERDLMAEQRIKIMISQIQPHFLYNTLATIQDMCLTEPKQAAKTIGKFGLYLRQNLESLEAPDLIPFERELEHTRLYTDIEQQRFGNLQVEYSVEDGDFCLPALTVQPLVENAIRHGVRTRNPGVVSVAARREEGVHLITVRDNGVGFDADAVSEIGRSHIGIRNVRSRLERMCGGTLHIKSRVGEGTVAEIRIPTGESKEKTP
ncbi:MAG: hypothetical protein E7211_19475 [Clostridium lundense]|nr:hypothetical protein [Clostridium lundense]